MIKYLYRIWKLPQMVIASWNVVQAKDLLARNKVNAAEERIDNAICTFEHIRPDKKIPEFYILQGLIKFVLDKDVEGCAIYKNAWHELSSTSELSEYDKRYLKGYMYGFLHLNGETESLNLEGIDPENFGDIPLDEVSSNLKIDFPFRDHPNWIKLNK